MPSQMPASTLCCDMHNAHCEPPSELCCQNCTEIHHGFHNCADVMGLLVGNHHDGSACVLAIPRPVERRAMSNLGKWAPWYADLPADAAPQAYGDSEAYRIGADWLKDCETVEDWGCGLGWARQFYRPGQYRGIDGTASPYADEVADLAEYRSWVNGIFMRGVIEHDHAWARILENALSSSRERICLVLFTPMVLHGPVQCAQVEEIGVPDLSFSHRNISKILLAWDCDWSVETIDSPNTGYGVETIFLIESAS